MEYITTANVLVWLFVTLGFFLMFISYWLAAAALFPVLVEKCERQFGHPVVTTLFGLLVMGLPVAAGLTVLKAAPPALKWTGLVLVAVPILLGLIGSAGPARRIGSGLPSPQDAGQAWRRVLRGGVVLALTFLLPLIGQALVMPLVMAAGVGAVVISWFRRPVPAPVSETASASAEPVP